MGISQLGIVQNHGQQCIDDALGIHGNQVLAAQHLLRDVEVGQSTNKNAGGRFWIVNI